MACMSYTHTCCVVFPELRTFACSPGRMQIIRGSQIGELTGIKLRT